MKFNLAEASIANKLMLITDTHQKNINLKKISILILLLHFTDFRGMPLFNE